MTAAELVLEGATSELGAGDVMATGEEVGTDVVSGTGEEATAEEEAEAGVEAEEDAAMGAAGEGVAKLPGRVTEFSTAQSAADRPCARPSDYSYAGKTGTVLGTHIRTAVWINQAEVRVWTRPRVLAADLA